MHLTFLGPLGLFVVAAGGLSVAIAERSRDRAARARLPLAIALCASLAAILFLTMGSVTGRNALQLVPIVGGVRQVLKGHLPTNAIGNLVLFLPLGATFCLVGLRLRSAIAVGLCFSTAIEIVQLFIPGRTTSINDVLLNTTSTFLGFVLVAHWAPSAPAE